MARHCSKSVVRISEAHAIHCPNYKRSAFKNNAAEKREIFRRAKETRAKRDVCFSVYNRINHCRKILNSVLAIRVKSDDELRSLHKRVVDSCFERCPLSAVDDVAKDVRSVF